MMRVKSDNRFNLKRCVPLSRDEEHRCATEYAKTREPRLAERLVVANMRLVVLIARGYRHANCDLGDLIQEGNRGLMRAVELYDPERGVRLSSYAAWWIRAYIMKFTLSNWRLVKAGTTEGQRRLFFGLRKARSKLACTGIEAESSQLAALLKVKEKDLAAMLERVAGSETSLDAPVQSSQGGPKSIGDSLSAEPTWRPDVWFETSEFDRLLRAKLEAFGDSLRGREADIFRRRLLSEDPDTLASLAATFGVSRERTRQVERHLKTRIRNYLTEELGDSLEMRRAAA
jgi:RNA polymerase sigma-32 factor